jgi:hypothetical protein
LHFNIVRSKCVATFVFCHLAPFQRVVRLIAFSLRHNKIAESNDIIYIPAQQ